MSPDPPKREVIQISTFKGADLTSDETSMDIGRSPSCPNMIRSSPGKVRKRMGYHLEGTYDGRINGYATNGEWQIIHAGTKLYYINADGSTGIFAENRQAAIEAHRQGVPVTDTGVADTKSVFVSAPGNGKTERVFFDGVHMRKLVKSQNVTTLEYIYYAPKISEAEGVYIPKVMIGKNPDGTGGEYYEEVNCLTDKWKESFCVTSATASQRTFKLTFDALTSTPVTAEIMNTDGVTWTDKSENTDFTVDRTHGTITFNVAPGASPSEGTDNVVITAARDHSEQRARIEHCTIARTYGDTAKGTRLFCTGNPDYPNRDFWSAVNDHTYFPDTNFSTLGLASSRIIGYSEVGGLLAAHKDEKEGTIYVRTTVTDEDGIQQFKVSSVISGEGAIAPYSFARITNEPLFLTRRGIYAITTADLTQDKYTQSRSFFLEGALLKEADLEEAYACVFRDYYVLAVNDRLYILDGATKEYVKNEPYSSYQYEGFYFTDIHARTLWVRDNVLYFGDSDGHIFAFYTDDEALSSYSDNGSAIHAHWQTPALTGSAFYMNKHFKRCAIQTMPYAATGVLAYARKQGIWSLMYSSPDKYRYFTFNGLDFSRFSFSSDMTARAVVNKIAIKKVDDAAFRFENNENVTPFSIINIALEYVQSRIYKG